MLPYLQDFEVKIAEGNTKINLGKILCDEVRSYLSENSAFYSLAEQCEYNYRGMSWYKQRGQTKDKPWKDACDFWTSLTEWIICALAARIDSILFSIEPVMTASAVESSDVAKAPGITDFADMVMREIVKIRENIKFYFKQKIKQPLAVASYEWVYEEDLVREVEQGQVQADFSVILQSGEVIPSDKLPKEITEEIEKGNLLPGQVAMWYVERDKPIINQPKLNYISPKDYVWTPATKKKQKPFLEGYRFWQTMGQIRKKRKNKEYELSDENMARLETTLNKKAQGGDLAKRVLVERAHQFECFRIFTRLPFNKKGEIDIEDKEAEEQEVIIEVALEENVLLKICKWYYLRHPAERRVFLYGWYEEQDDIVGDMPFVGRSMTEKLSDINKLINKEFQQIVDNADLAMCKIFTKRKMLNEEEYEEPEVFPGAFWEIEQRGDIEVLEVGDVKRIGFQIMDNLLSFAVRLSNISPMNVSERMEGAKPLATEVVNMLREGEIGREDLIQSCHEDLRTIYKWTIDYYFQFIPDGLERRIRGDTEQLIFPEAPSKEKLTNKEEYQTAMELFEKQKYYAREELVGVGKWDFKWNGTQLSGERQWQIQTADYLTQILPQFLQGGLVTLSGVWEALRDSLMARGKKDWQKYLVSREQIMAQEQAGMFAMSQPDLRDKLIAKGIPPEVADMAIARANTQKGGGAGGREVVAKGR